MNDKQFTGDLLKNLPPVPDTFHTAMVETLHTIVNTEAEKAQTAPVRKPMRSVRRTVLLAALITALLATAAVAAYHWHMFDNIWFFHTPPRNLDTVMMATDVYSEVVNNVEISVDEVGYDGRTLYLRYHHRMLDVDTPLLEYYEGEPVTGISLEAMELLSQHNVGWWIDHIWFDGKAMDMPGNSGAEASGTTTPGEIVQSEYWRLDNEGVTLRGKVDISLPIGERQSLEMYRKSEHPENYDADGNLKLPQKGMVTFTVDVGDIADRVVVENPNIPVTTELLTAGVSEVCFTPLMTYITLQLEVNPNKLAAYIAENGEGFYNEEGVLLWPYGGMDVFDEWIFALSLVDGEGNEMFPGEFGNNGYGNEWAEFTYPSMETIPDELWLAPVQEGVADMTRAVRVH